MLDDGGRVPFAFLGVLLLLTSMLSMAYISGLQFQQLEDRVREDVIQEGMEISALVHREVETEAYLMGTRAVQLGGGNRSRVASLYDDMMNSYLDESFPRTVERFRFGIRNHSSSIILESRTLEDFGKEARVENETFGNLIYEELETDRSGYWMELQRTMTFSVAGYVTYVMSKDGITARNKHEFSQDLDSLVPFLKGKMDSLVSGALSEFGNIARITEYMLSTLAQVRVLQGWGSSEQGVPSTDEIIEIGDVERALNLALILEHLALLRSVDEDTIEAFDLNNRGADNNTSLARLLETWIGTGSLDPSDLLLLYAGQGEANVSIGTIVSQAIYAMVDQMTLKYFDYFGLTPVADISLQAAQVLANSIQDFLFWISGNDREAWLTRSWFKDMAREIRASTLISYPFVFPVPESEFQISTETGGMVNFTVAGFAAYVPFEIVDVAEGFDGFWRSCYHLVYDGDLRVVYETQRDLVKEMAGRVGEMVDAAGPFSAVSMDGVVPTDNVSALQDLSEAVREKTYTLLIQIRDNESFVREIISVLWEAQTNLTANVFSRIADEVDSLVGDEGKSVAHETIFEQILRRVENQTEYGSLTLEEREQLADIIESSVLEGGLGVAAQGLMVNRTIANLEEMRWKATSMDTMSEDGGLYSKLRDFVVSSSGILAEASESIAHLVDSTVEAEDVENIRFLVSTTNETFRFWDGGVNSREAARRSFRAEVSQQPSYLSGESWRAECDAKELRVGTLCVSIDNPSDSQPGSGRNVHYTDVTRTSFAPYVSTWRIRVRALIDLSIATDRASGGVSGQRDSITTSIPLEFEISISARSGWALAGVAYDSSNTFLEDVWDTFCAFLEDIWDGLLKVFDWILDGVSWLVSLVKELIGTLLSYAQDVLRAINDVIEATTELLRSSISSVAGLVGGIIEGVISAFGATTFQMSVLGGELEIGLNKGNGRVIEGIFETGCLKTVLLLSKLSDMNLTQEQKKKATSEYDIVVNVDISLGYLNLNGTFDPAMVFEGSFFHAVAEWGEEWRIEFEVPHVEKFHEKRYAVEIPSIPTPIGTLDIELGMLIKLREELVELDFIGIVSKSFESAWAETLGEEISIDSAARFAELGISNTVDGLAEAIEDNIERVIEVVLYFEGQVKIGGTAGIGVRLAFIIGKEVLREGFLWLSAKLRGLISEFGSPPSVSVEEDLAGVLAASTYLGFEVLLSVGTPRLVKMMSSNHEFGTEMLFVISIRMNIAAMAQLLGMGSESWRVDFGICIEGMPPSFFGDAVQKGETANLWLVRGTATQLN